MTGSDQGRRDRLGEVTFFNHFPEAKLICEQFPAATETVENFTAQGLVLETIEAVVQQTCSSLKEFAARTRLRADTTPVLLKDDEFWGRQATLEAAAQREQNRPRLSIPCFEEEPLTAFRGAYRRYYEL